MAKKDIYQELAELFDANKKVVIDLWQKQLKSIAGAVVSKFGEAETKRKCTLLFESFNKGLPYGEDITIEAYSVFRAALSATSTDFNAKQLTPSETATFIFSLKDALLNTMQVAYPNKERLNELVGTINRLIDRLGLITFDFYVIARDEMVVEKQKELDEVREKLIREQKRTIIETAAPVVKIWDRILMVPLIGILDSERTQLVMDRMLGGIEETQSKVVILDITGIPAVDTLVARHLISTATAVRLMGAECIVTGISARIAQTVVQMGIDLKGINTKGNMADGLREAFAMVGQKIGVR